MSVSLKRNFTCLKEGDEKIRLLFKCHNLDMNYPLYDSYDKSFLGVSLFDFILAPLTMFMNVVVLFTIYKHKSLHNKPANCIIFSLALSDMLTGLFTQPIKGIVMLNIFKCEPNCAFNIAALQLSYSLGIVSYLTLSLITLERYIAIIHPYKYQQLTTSNKLVIRLIIGIWLLATLTTGLSFLTPQMLLQRLFAIGISVVSFALCVTAHVKIVRTVNGIQRNIRRQQTTARGTSLSAIDGGTRFVANRTNVMSKATAVALSVLIVMSLCYLPSAVFTALRFFGMDNDFVRVFQDWTNSFVLMNSTINPLIYCFQMKDMRRKAYEIIKPRRSTRISECTRGEIGPHKEISGQRGRQHVQNHRIEAKTKETQKRDTTIF
eukprot:gene9326-10310_t